MIPYTYTLENGHLFFNGEQTARPEIHLILVYDPENGDVMQICHGTNPDQLKAEQDRLSELTAITGETTLLVNLTKIVPDPEDAVQIANYLIDTTLSPAAARLVQALTKGGAEPIYQALKELWQLAIRFN